MRRRHSEPAARPARRWEPAQEERLRRIIRELSHELRTPLTALRSHLETMSEGIWKPTPEQIHVCYREVLRLERLVDDLDELVAAEDDTLRLERERVETGELVRVVAQAFAPLLSEQKITLVQGPLPPAAPVYVDPDKICQVLTNLLDNARKYTPPGGRVAIRAARRSKWVAVTVQDSGPGIASDLPLVFERFFRRRPFGARPSGGTGLGLAMARAVAEAHGGSLSAANARGGGSVFTLRLPLDGAGGSR